LLEIHDLNLTSGGHLIVRMQALANFRDPKPTGCKQRGTPRPATKYHRNEKQMFKHAPTVLEGNLFANNAGKQAAPRWPFGTRPNRLLNFHLNTKLEVGF
jgi:hypothetical protein